MKKNEQETLFREIKDSKEFTPAIKQYLEIKSQYPECILFFRMGDFYEMFFEDAIIASKVLNIVLTTRDKRSENPIPLCGVPYHSAKPYIEKLISAGYKVAICEQVEDPKQAKGIVKREVVKVITPGLPVDTEFVDGKENVFIASVVKGEKRWGIAYMDITTGEVRSAELLSIQEVIDVLNIVNPKELLFYSSEVKDALGYHLKCTFTSTDNPPPSPLLAEKLLTGFFRVSSLNGFGIKGLREGLSAVWLLIDYAKKTQGENLSHISSIKPHITEGVMNLDAETIRNLELFESITGEKRYSVITLIDLTKTPMGGRRLREWLRNPLTDIKRINERLDAVDTFYQNKALRKDVSEKLKDVPDLERLASRISMQIITPSELRWIANSADAVSSIKEIIERSESPFLPDIGGYESFMECVNLIDKTIKENPSNSPGDGNVIRKGANPELDTTRELINNTKSAILKLETEERTRTGIPSLKVGYNKVFGYYIEVTKPHLKLVPDDYIRKQTLVNAERFVNQKLKEFEEKILHAEEKVKELENEIYRALIKELIHYVHVIKNVARVIGEIDCYCGLSELAEKRHYTRPEVNDSDEIEIKEGRHPVVEAFSEEEFIPNDLYVNTSKSGLLIITGPNMAGKSTYLRQSALIMILAQMGSFVPALHARIGVVDRIFTRIGAADDIARGRSTFMVEMNETANILHNATRKSFIILDEVGRGTSTFDGISIAWAVCEYILKHIKARTLFATHYHELTELEKEYDEVKNYHFAVKEWGGTVIFLRKILEGASSISYGIEVAKLAGIPDEVIKRAREILQHLELLEMEKSTPFSSITQQVGLFEKKGDPVRKKLKEVNIATITPIEAINLLYELKKITEEEKE